MKLRTTISDLSQIRQLDLYLELRELGVLMTRVAENFPEKIQLAAAQLNEGPNLEELGISKTAIARFDRAIKAMKDAQESGALEMEPLLEMDLIDQRHSADQNIQAERLEIVSEELKLIRKKLREDKQNPGLLADGRYRHLVKKFIERHFVMYGVGGSDIPDENIKKKPPRTKVEFPHPSKWSKLTITFIDLETVQIKLDGEQPVSRTFADMGFENKKNGKPNIQWTMLQAFAKENGELYSAHALLKSRKAKIKAEQQVKRIRSILRNIFKLKQDPIPWVKKDQCYHCEFTLRMDEYIQEELKELIP